MTRAKPKDTDTEQTEDAAAPTMFVYVGEDARTYEDRALEVAPGDIHEWPDGAPDYRWEPATDEQVAEHTAKLDALAQAAADETPAPDPGGADSTPADETGPAPGSNDQPPADPPAGDGDQPPADPNPEG